MNRRDSGKFSTLADCFLWLVDIGGSRGGTGGPDSSEKSQNIGFLSNTGPDPLKNHKAIKPALNAGSS